MTRPAAAKSPAAVTTIGIVDVAFFAASASGCAHRHDHIDLGAHELLHDGRELLRVAVGVVLQ
ncbi:MAG: hypothetical protein M3R58_06020 [Pseudomonadota bacterium]|nr:hypothetical protein [Pseudomonadota bacterium]